MQDKMRNNTVWILKLEMVIQSNIMNKTQQISTVLTGKLIGLMGLLPENKSSELLHPGWRGPFLVAEKPL